MGGENGLRHIEDGFRRYVVKARPSVKQVQIEDMERIKDDVERLRRVVEILAAYFLCTLPMTTTTWPRPFWMSTAVVASAFSRIFESSMAEGRCGDSA